MMKECDRALYYIMLTLTKGLGPVRQRCLLEAAGGIDGLFSPGADRPDVSKCPGLQTFLSCCEDPQIQKRAEKILESARQKKIRVITPEDAEYPGRFGLLPGLPVVLYALGDLRINAFEASVGIVGARRCTGEGKRKAIEAAEKAAAENKAVVSGMARGIDSYAHTAAVRSDGYTIAVLGSGPDICYPKEHAPLYKKIMETGCILSEYPPGTLPRGYTFPQRNRIIAALSDELLVLEAGRTSGTRTTVEAWERKSGSLQTVHKGILNWK